MKAVFIKIGAGGSHIRYVNKYVRMAHAMHERDKLTILVASNPSDELSFATTKR